MNSRDYWKAREETQRQKNIAQEAEYSKRIQGIYTKMYQNIQDDINSFYVKYADAEGITLAEAKKRISKLDIDEYAAKAKRYVEQAAKDRAANHGKTDRTAAYFSDQANAEMRLYNATMKINRLELLKAHLGLEMIEGHDELEKLFGDALTQRTLDEFKRQAGILGNTILNNEKLADSIVNASFHNAEFSDRVWMAQDLMKYRLHEILTQALIKGLNPRALTRELMPLIKKEILENKRAAAERLLRTELCRVQTDAQMKSFERNGYDKYIFLAEPTACPHCRALDDKVFDVKDAMPGENAPPLHPNCRCSTSSYAESDEEYEKWFYETTGKHSAQWESGNTKQKEDVKPEKIKKVKKQQEYKQEDRSFKELSLDEFKTMKGDCTAAERKIIYGRLKKGYIASGEAKHINESLRIGKSLDEHQQKVADMLRTVISKNTIKDDIMVYRYVGDHAFSDMTGIKFPKSEGFLPTSAEGFAKMRDEFNSWIDDLPNQIKKGKVYKEKAFFSTSGVFDKNVFDNRRTLIKMKVPKGAKGYVTTNNRESEIIFDRPTVVIDGIEIDNGKIVINCGLRV